MTSSFDREGRFADLDRGQGILTGFQDASKDPVDKKYIKRLLKPYRKYGVPQNLSKLKGMSDTELEIMAAKAVIKQRGIKINWKLRRSLNRKKYGAKKIDWAKRVMEKKKSGATVRPKALRKTRTARQHINRIRANRRAMKKPFWRA